MVLKKYKTVIINVIYLSLFILVMLFDFGVNPLMGMLNKYIAFALFIYTLIKFRKLPYREQDEKRIPYSIAFIVFIILQSFVYNLYQFDYITNFFLTK